MTTTTYTLSLARSANGNWSLTMPSDDLPPMAFPASMSPSEAQDYAASFLPLAHIPAPATLAWHQYGYTYPATSAGQQSPAYRASWTVQVQSLSPKGA